MNPAQSISQYLADLFDKKAAPLQKRREAAAKKGELDAVGALTASIQALKERYELDQWMGQAANSMAKSLQYGTHIAKGLNPKSKGSNIVTHLKKPCSKHVTTPALSKYQVDVGGSAAALPLAKLFELKVGEKTIRELIIDDDPALVGCFASCAEESGKRKDIFKSCLLGGTDLPLADARGKFIHWPTPHDPESAYVTLAPLYPSSLCHEVNIRRSNALSKENAQAKNDRFRSEDKPRSYVSLPDMAVINLGGSKPQNVSRLVNAMAGKSYIFPALPPSTKSMESKPISMKSPSVFHARLYIEARPFFMELYRVIIDWQNNVKVRRRRKDALHAIIMTVNKKVSIIHKKMRPGWSIDYPHLPLEEAIWLDPKRFEAPSSIRPQMYLDDSWKDRVADRFADWVQGRIRRRFPRVDAFDDADWHAWRAHFTARNAVPSINFSGAEHDGQ